MTEDHQNLSVTLCRECSRSYKVPQQALPAPSARDDLRRRRLPSETEAQAIQLAILDTYQHLASIEEEVMKILAQAEAMEELKKILQRSIETRQALVAPVRRLPVELLSEVFDLVCDDDGEYMCDKLPMPLVLSSVSKVWRDVMINSSKIWARVPVHCILPGSSFGFLPYRLGTSEENTWKRVAIRRLRLHLSGIGNETLAHTVTFAPHCLGDRWLDWFPMVMEYSSSWCSLRIAADEFFETFGQRSLVRLERLEIEVDHLTSVTADKHHVFMHAPLLHHLTIKNFRAKSHPTLMCLPWKQITSLTAEYCSDAYLLDMLVANCPQLTTLSHMMRGGTNEHHQMTPSTTHHTFENLQDLTIDRAYQGAHTQQENFLNRMTAPRLHTITLQTSWPQSWFAYDPSRSPLASFLARSQGALRNLHMLDFTVKEWDFISSAGATKELRTLQVRVNFDCEPLLLDLSFLGDARVFPLLESFRLDGYIMASLDGHTMTSMIAKRAANGGRLNHLEIRIEEPDANKWKMAREDYERLVKMLPRGVLIWQNRERYIGGLEIRVTHYSRPYAAEDCDR